MKRTPFVAALLCLSFCFMKSAFAGEFLVDSRVETVTESGGLPVVEARLVVFNDTGADAYGLAATLATDEEGVRVLESTAHLGDVPAGEEASSDAPVRLEIDTELVPSLNVAIEVDLAFQDAEGQAHSARTHVVIPLE